jgi:hypothetical protein
LEKTGEGLEKGQEGQKKEDRMRQENDEKRIQEKRNETFIGTDRSNEDSDKKQVHINSIFTNRYM